MQAAVEKQHRCCGAVCMCAVCGENKVCTTDAFYPREKDPTFREYGNIDRVESVCGVYWTEWEPSSDGVGRYGGNFLSICPDCMPFAYVPELDPHQQRAVCVEIRDLGAWYSTLPNPFKTVYKIQ